MKRVLEWIIIISLIGTFSLEILDFGSNAVTFVTVKTYNFGGYLGVRSLYQFDVFRYLSNLSQTFDRTLQLKHILPADPGGTFGLDIGHNFAVITNYIIYIINMWLMPLRFAMIPAQFWFAILGININVIEAPFTQVISAIINATIPYIPY